jgi:putative FmdB family regulatory protein
MPTYEYRCTECGHEFEEFQAISDPPITICPKCKGKTERIISGGTGLIFKGSGFYITDYKNKERRSDGGITSPSSSSKKDSKSTSTSKTGD